MQENRPALLPFAQAASLWLETRRKISPRTRCDYEKYIAALNSFFAAIPLASIHIGHILEYQTKRQRGELWSMRCAGASRINHELNTLSQVLTRAGLWAALHDLYEPLPLPTNHKGRALSPEEEARFWASAHKKRRWLVAANCTMITAMTTAGPGEIRHLHMRDVDVNRGYIYIREGVKNQYRVREVPLNAQALEAVRWLYQRAKDAGSTSPDDYMLYRRAATRGGEPIFTAPMGSWKTGWYAIIADCGLQDITPYTWRHHAITKMLEHPDVSERTAMSVAGHISNRMFDRYSHTRNEAKKAAVEALTFTPPAPTLQIIKG